MGGQSSWDTRPPSPRHPGSVGARHGAVQWRGGLYGDPRLWTVHGWPQVAPAWIHTRDAARGPAASRKEVVKLATQLLCLPLRPFSKPHPIPTTPHDVLTCLHSRLEGSGAASMSNHCCKKSVSDPFPSLRRFLSSFKSIALDLKACVRWGPFSPPYTPAKIPPHPHRFALQSV